MIFSSTSASVTKVASRARVKSRKPALNFLALVVDLEGGARPAVRRAVTMGFLTVSDNRYTANPQELFENDEYKMPF